MAYEVTHRLTRDEAHRVGVAMNIATTISDVYEDAEVSLGDAGGKMMVAVELAEYRIFVTPRSDD